MPFAADHLFIADSHYILRVNFVALLLLLIRFWFNILLIFCCAQILIKTRNLS